ncbi:hypothetical protein PCE1_002253 [Barthelona sp. PCE]
MSKEGTFQSFNVSIPMDKIRLSDPKEQNNESYHVRVHLYSNVCLEGGLRSDYHEVGCLEIQNCVLPNSNDFNAYKYAILTHEELLATYNNIKGPRLAPISRDMVSKASCHVIGLCIFTGKHYLRRILNDEHIKIIWSALKNNWIKPEFEKDDFIRMIRASNIKITDAELAKMLNDVYITTPSKRSFITERSLKYVTDNANTKCQGNIHYNKDTCEWTCTDIGIIQDSIFPLRFQQLTLQEHQITKMKVSLARVNDARGFALPFVFLVMDKSLKNIRSEYSPGSERAFRDYTTYYGEVVHPYILETIFNSAYVQAANNSENVTLFMEFDLSSDGYSAALIMLKVPTDLELVWVEHPFLESSTKMYTKDHLIITLEQYLDSLKGKFIIFDVFTTEFTVSHATEVVINPLDYPDFTVRNFEVPEIDKDAKYKRAQDLCEQFLSRLKKYKIIQSYSIIERKNRDRWCLEDVIIDMGDSEVKIVVGTDNGTPEQLAFQKICDACSSISRVPCICHVLNKIMAKTSGFEFFPSHIQHQSFIPYLDRFNLLRVSNETVTMDIIDQVSQESTVEGLSKKLDLSNLFTNRTISRSAAARLNSVVSLHETHPIFALSEPAAENESVTDDISGATINNLTEEWIESFVHSDTEGGLIADDKLMFTFAYTSFHECQHLQNLLRQSNACLLGVDLTLSNSLSNDAYRFNVLEHYTEFLDHLAMISLEKYAKMLDDQQKSLANFSKIQTLLTVDTMRVFYKYHTVWCEVTGRSISLSNVRWDTLEWIYDVLCGGLYMDIPKILFLPEGTETIPDDFAITWSHFKITKKFLRLKYHEVKDLAIKRMLKSNNTVCDEDHYRHFLSPFYEAMKDGNKQPHGFSLGPDMWVLARNYFSTYSRMIFIQRMSSKNDFSVLQSYFQVSILLLELRKWRSDFKVRNATSLATIYHDGLFEYVRHYFCKFLIMPEPLVAFLLSDLSTVELQDHNMEVKDITNDKPRKSCLKEELYELYVDAKIPNINRAGLVEVTEKELVRLKGMMVFSFLPTKFKRCGSECPALHLISDHVYVNMAKDFNDPLLYRGLVGYIISILCTNYYLDFSPSNEDRKKVVMRYTPEVEPQTIVLPLSTGFLSPSRRSSNRMESELSPSAQSVHEPPLSAQRVADEFDFNDTGIRERDVRAALVHGHTHESVKGLPGFRAIIRQHSSASASNSGVEREFSMLKRLHSKNQTKLSTHIRFNWFLLNEASAAPRITYDELKEIVKTI